MSLNKDTLLAIGKHIVSGLKEEEACILLDVDYDDLVHLMEINPTVRNYIEKMHIEFKYRHLSEMQKSKSEKTSQWLLEKLRPEEFGTKARPTGDTTINIVGQIIQEIQNDTRPIIRLNREGQGQNQGGEVKKISVSEVLK